MYAWETAELESYVTVFSHTVSGMELNDTDDQHTVDAPVWTPSTADCRQIKANKDELTLHGKVYFLFSIKYWILGTEYELNT